VGILREIAGQFELGWAYISACLSAPLTAPACKATWTWVTIALLLIGLIVLWKLLAWLLRPLAMWFSHMRLHARERQIADADTMARYKVDESKLFSGPAEDDVEQKIREALAQKKLDDLKQRHHQRLDDKKS